MTSDSKTSITDKTVEKVQEIKHKAQEAVDSAKHKIEEKAVELTHRVTEVVEDIKNVGSRDKNSPIVKQHIKEEKKLKVI